ncbi:phosphate acyltransferase PlsX [Roseospirillum parvum]|uniref:Phosphate acyltransferase n=1 Tax=Roseospirillum parvum TaxID=83401 RepID=A0A1G7YC52_9PROT|nr:phosphate acyltransferase PlsX [Roseospirillum parvum]SDG93974.1 glycerol-3-phosphate acyltransferase PlsX [Roseospirillum parvum]
MTSGFTLSLDAMGGDHAPTMVVEGLKKAHVRYPAVRYLLFGDQARLSPLVDKAGLGEVTEIVHTDQAVSNDDKPSQVLRRGRQTSMWLAIEAVKEGRAAGVVSAGNTGALMALAKFQLRTLPGIDRPAIASLMPNIRGESVMLDLGANTECDANNLIEFAIMGEVFARVLLGLERPTIALLNVGSEDLKGTEALRQAANTLREESDLSLDFKGFVEGDDLGKGTVDVVVTDGFTGNVALKSVEGTARLYSSYLREAFASSLVAKLGYLLASRALHKVRMRADPRRYNGAMLLGLNGIAVKSHGGTDALGFANAVGVAIDLISQGLNDRIREEFRHLHAPHGEVGPELGNSSKLGENSKVIPGPGAEPRVAAAGSERKAAER